MSWDVCLCVVYVVFLFMKSTEEMVHLFLPTRESLSFTEILYFIRDMIKRRTYDSFLMLLRLISGLG